MQTWRTLTLLCCALAPAIAQEPPVRAPAAEPGPRALQRAIDDTRAAAKKLFDLPHSFEGTVRFDALSRPGPRFLRTARHPSAVVVEDATTFDHLYEGADTFEEVYAAITDELVAAAARHLGIGHYDVREIGPDWYAADDHDGSRGVYHMLSRDDHRRVTLSWGARQSALLGTVSGSALTVLTFTAEGDRTLQRLETYVVIDNAVAAGLARALVALFGHIADRKLARGFEMTARVASWAREHPDQFCVWLAAQPAHLAHGPAGRSPASLCADQDHPVASLAR